MDPPTSRAAYLSKQVVKITRQETDDSNPVEENYERYGLILVTEIGSSDGWHRLIEEYVSDIEFLDALREREIVPRSELIPPHERFLDACKIDLETDDGVAVVSSVRNTELGELGTQDNPSVPVAALHLPTLTPVMPNGPVDYDDDWKAEVTLTWAAGVFPTTYLTKLTKKIGADLRMEMRLDDQAPKCEVHDVRLSLHPGGSWTIDLAEATGRPTRGKGKMSFVVRADYVNDEEEPVKLKVIDFAHEFEWFKVPLSFDDDNLYCTAWQRDPTGKSPFGSAAGEEGKRNGPASPGSGSGGEKGADGKEGGRQPPRNRYKRR